MIRLSKNITILMLMELIVHTTKQKIINIDILKKIILGAWRWLGIYENKEIISKIVFLNKKGIDFGGARGPISLKSMVCDRLSEDIFDRKIKYKDKKKFETNL